MTSAAPGGRDLRPLAVAALTAASRWASSAAGPAGAGPGPTSGAVTVLRGRPAGLGPAAGQHVEQPRFVVAGLAVAWTAGDRLRLGLTRAHPGVATAYAVVVVLLGPGSMAMHATQSDLGGHLDLLSMFALSGFVLAYALMRSSGAARPSWPWSSARLSSRAWPCTCGGEVAVLGHVGNAAFAVQLVAAVGIEAALVRRRSPHQDVAFGLASLLVLASAFAIWTTGKRGHAWCHPESLLQQHGLWHVLCAVSAYLLFRHYAAERAAGGRPGWPDPAHGG